MWICNLYFFRGQINSINRSGSFVDFVGFFGTSESKNAIVKPGRARECRNKCLKSFLSPPVQFEMWVHMHHFLPTSDKNSCKIIIHISGPLIGTD